MTKCTNKPNFRNAQAKRAFELLLKNDSVAECGINDSRQIYIIWTGGFVDTYSRYDFINNYINELPIFPVWIDIVDGDYYLIKNSK